MIKITKSPNHEITKCRPTDLPSALHNNLSVSASNWILKTRLQQWCGLSVIVTPLYNCSVLRTVYCKNFTKLEGQLSLPLLPFQYPICYCSTAHLLCGLHVQTINQHSHKLHFSPSAWSGWLLSHALPILTAVFINKQGVHFSQQGFLPLTLQQLLVRKCSVHGDSQLLEPFAEIGIVLLINVISMQKN